MFADLIKPTGRERSVVAAILACGVIARLVWVVRPEQIKPLITESHNVAVSLAKTGRFADPFGNGGGPTAHVGMLTPLPSALAYRLFGVDTPLAEFILSIWAAAVVVFGLWLLWRLAVLLQVPRLARIGAIAFIALVPLQFGLEMREGRSWEVNLAVLLLVWTLLRLVEADRKPDVGARALAVTGALAGFLYIVSPPAGLAAVMAIALFHLLRLPLRHWWIAPAGFVLVAGLLAGFWAARNMERLGKPILLRDNLDLELALSNYSGALAPPNADAAYVARMQEIHPLGFGAAIKKLDAAGGEVAYYHQLGREADAWIVAHPFEFLELCAKRLEQFYLPPRWFWGMFGAPGKLVWLRQELEWTATIAGFLALIILAWLKRPYVYILCAILGCSAIYILVQPTLRYRYLVSSLLIVMAFDGMARLYSYLRHEAPLARAAIGHAPDPDADA
jgi:hypothetical protein